MPPPFERHVFVCVNERPPDSPKGCCKAKGAEDVASALKDAVAARGLKGRMRVNTSGCLDACARGVTVVVYPDGIWYGGVTTADVAEIVESHLVGGRPVDRLRIGATSPPAR